MPKKRYVTTPQKLMADVPRSTKLPTDSPIAIYYRQSTDAQVGNVSTAMQTIDMVAYVQQCGWDKSKITLIDMDAGISGSTKIDERPGMSELFTLITNGKIGAVACQDEDRLFRDITQIQVNVFIEACRENQVLVLTPTMVYDFANTMTGTFHARQFRFKSEMAADYINTVIRGKLHRAKKRQQLSGQWGGAGIPVGYMIDMRRILPDGSKNMNYKKLAVFEPFAQVVREHFRLFLSFSGNVRKTTRHIVKHGPHFPNPDECQPPEGFKVHYKLKRREYGYYMSRTSVKLMLSNAQYIGHWLYQGAVVIYDNHPPVIDEATFMRAFNYLSDVTFEGKPNDQFTPIQQNARPTLDEEREEDRPLLAGLMVSKHEGKWRQVGTKYVTKAKLYSYTCWSSFSGKYVWGKRADYVDEAVLHLLKEKLTTTFNQAEWERAVEEFTQSHLEQQQLQQAQLGNLEQVMNNLITNLESLSNQHLIQATEKRYEDALTEYERLKTELAASRAEVVEYEHIRQLQGSFGSVIDKWENTNSDEQRQVVTAFIKKVEATPTEGHGLHLMIYWRDGSTNEVLLPRRSTRGINWLPHEVSKLIRLVQSGASQIAIASAFPDRKWKYICHKYYQEVGGGLGRFNPKPVGHQESYNEYLERVGDDFLADSGLEGCSEIKPLDVIEILHRGAAMRHRRPILHS